MSTEPKCPECGSENTYDDGSVKVCPDCSHEWDPNAAIEEQDASADSGVIKDAFGNILSDGDSITVIKDLKVKGSSSGVKVGTKVKGIRLRESDDGHTISCKIDGIGAMYLKPEFVKKA